MKKAIFTIISISFSMFVCTAQTYTPIGNLDFADSYGGYGWAYDEDAGTLPIDVHVYIDGRFYAVLNANQSRPDLVSAGITPNPEHGFSFTITGYDTTRAHEIVVYAINYGGGPNITLANCPFRVGTQPSGDAIISNVAGPSSITITTTQRFAGSIASLIWYGKEFINSADHGRELQSATSFNNWGECFNPTEAGSAQDNTGNTSTSFLQYLYSSGNCLETQTLPAFWTQPGDTAPGCGYAVNTSERASQYFYKKVTIGMPGMPHVIQYNTAFDLPLNSSYSNGTFEVVTAYMPADFSVFWNYDPESQQLTTLSDGPGEQGIPIVFSTTDSSYAMGIYSPDLPDSIYPNEGYGRFRYDDCTKWNCVFKESPVASGTYKYRSYVIVGSLTNVEVSMTQLYNYFTITADFSADTVCAGTPTTFTDLSIGVNAETSYQWDIYNDGSIDGTTSGNFTYTFSSGGTYMVKLNTMNGVAPDHQSSIIKNVVVLAPPGAAGSISGNTSVCEGSQQNYSVSSVSGATSYTWSLPSGWSGGSDSTSIDATVGTNAGIVSVTAHNSCGSGAPSSFITNVNPLPPTPVISYTILFISSNTSYGNQWYNQDGIIAGATGQIYTPTAAGDYFVIVTDENGCVSDTSNIITVGITDVDIYSNQDFLYSIYPDPAIDNINVENTSSVHDMKEVVSIYNPQGQLLKKQQLQQALTNIDISAFAKGIYFLKIENSIKFKMKKFIKQ